MLSGGGVSNYYVVSVGEGVRQGETGMFLPWRHTQCHGEVRPGGAAKAGTAHESGLGRRRRRRGHLRRRRVGHERLEGVELLLGRRRRRLARGAQAEGRRRVVVRARQGEGQINWESWACGLFVGDDA